MVWLLRHNLDKFLHIFDLRIQNTNEVLDKTVLKIWSQILEKMASEKALKKIDKKSTKIMKLSTIFGGFRGQNNSSYQISEANFQQANFP